MGIKPNRKKNFRVPSQDIKVKLHELLFINTLCFQRLYSIKQLGLVERVYPFATHTRGAHSLDCLDMAQRFVDCLRDNIRRLIPEEDQEGAVLQQIESDTDLIRAAALLHDITHIPYAHTLEDEMGILPRGDKGDRIDKMIDRLKGELQSLSSSSEMGNYRVFSFQTEEEFDKALKYAIELLEDVRKVLWTLALTDEELEEMEEKNKKKYAKKRLEPERFYIADIIGNTICADLLSYILRDVEFTGIEIKPGGWYRLFDYFGIKRDIQGRNRMVIRLTKKGELREDALSTIVGILNVRHALSEQVLYHHAKCAASAMLGKIASLCGLGECDELYDIGDEGLMNLLTQKIKAMKSSEEDIVRRRGEGAERLLDNLRARRFHKRFHRVPVSEQRPYGRADLSKVYSSPQHRTKLEEEIENEYGLEPGSVLIFCPASKMALKEAKALVVYEEIDEKGQIKETLSELDSQQCLDTLKRLHPSLPKKVENVVEQYEALWKLYVFVHPDVVPVYGAEIKARLTKYLGEGDRIFDHSYVEPAEAYKVSETIRENIVQEVPMREVSVVYQKIPETLESLPRKAGKKKTVNWLKENAHELVKAAIERHRARDKQERLPL